MQRTGVRCDMKQDDSGAQKAKPGARDKRDDAAAARQRARERAAEDELPRKSGPRKSAS